VSNVDSGTSAGNLEDFHVQYARKVYAFFRVRGLVRDDAMDLAQETWLQFRRGWGSYRNAEAMVFIIATQTFSKWVSRRRADLVSGNSPAPAGQQVDNCTVAGNFDTYGAVQRMDLLRALSGLPDRQKMVVFLVYMADLKQADVAAIMNCTVANVKKLVSDALATLERSPALEGYRVRRHQPTGGGA
jgi:RNA polymerase sigma factor (sigma-70 family)